MDFETFLHVIKPVLLGIAVWYGFRRGYEGSKKKKKKKKKNVSS